MRVHRHLPGSFSIPAVAYDGSPSGLSADGRTLVLISPRIRYPAGGRPSRSSDARRLALRRRISLKGDFSFDAISPDGRLMYLIQYNPREIGEYQVRAYDLRARRLFRSPSWIPASRTRRCTACRSRAWRTATAAGRTRSTRAPAHPFVHALDTEGRTAVCIDLHDLRQVSGRDARPARPDAGRDRPEGEGAGEDRHPHPPPARAAGRRGRAERRTRAPPGCRCSRPPPALLTVMLGWRRRRAVRTA